MIFYFWQNMPAMHQVPYQRELAALGHRVTLCVDRMMLPERAAMGWQPEDTSDLDLQVIPDRGTAKRILEESPADAIHLISGVRGVNNGGQLTRLAHRLGRRVCWICETWDHRGAKGLARGLLYRIEALRYRPCLEKIFAMGDLGARDQLKAGYEARQITPFNYVVPYGPQPRGPGAPAAAFKFGYVGSLIRRKRVDLLLQALAKLAPTTVEFFLEIHGAGPEGPALRALAENLGLGSRVGWMGSFPSSETINRISRLDTLVLPSDFDGWGAVVNEALLCGVPVVVSDACGAACIPARHGWGEVFRAGDVADCARACTRLMTQPPAVDPVAVESLIGARATAQRLLAALSHA